MRVKYICETHGYVVYNSSSGEFIATSSILDPHLSSDDPEVGDFGFGNWDTGSLRYTPD